MNILIAPDSFKDALAAPLVCEFLRRGLQQTFPAANCQLLPLADGGEGTLETLATVLSGEFVECTVHDPLFRPIQAHYLWLPSTATAVIEMARASGLELLAATERNARQTTTLGTGELVANALTRGARHLVLTVGGSATNDAGIGLATALGYTFWDENDQPVPPTGEHLVRIRRIDGSHVHPRLAEVSCRVVTDVTNPFHGPTGAAHVFAAQKGADAAAIAHLDAGLRHFAEVLQTTFGTDVQALAGSGAGGGMGGGAACFLKASITSAADWILDITHAADLLQASDLLITGEGRIDAQTWQGKLLARLLALATQHQVPVILVCGTLQNAEDVLADPNVLYATSILPAPMPLAEALTRTPELLETQGKLLGRLLSRRQQGFRI
ncbi:glycerate kinase [Hymenobacter volaticus]|uniref:Glycerate kinase n=1 Tax=Hymenobacter volaticus TaxID=2932254 RepID=A0ABY4G4N9_9BACT|nr:glycerate kinase [Hymenobacter volaticus]UOQ65737.1 glycerate kinase [Hymenobacter volaticus]